MFASNALLRVAYTSDVSSISVSAVNIVSADINPELSADAAGVVAVGSGETLLLLPLVSGVSSPPRDIVVDGRTVVSGSPDVSAPVAGTPILMLCFATAPVWFDGSLAKASRNFASLSVFLLPL